MTDKSIRQWLHDLELEDAALAALSEQKQQKPTGNCVHIHQPVMRPGEREYREPLFWKCQFCGHVRKNVCGMPMDLSEKDEVPEWVILA